MKWNKLRKEKGKKKKETNIVHIPFQHTIRPNTNSAIRSLFGSQANIGYRPNNLHQWWYHSESVVTPQWISGGTAVNQWWHRSESVAAPQWISGTIAVNQWRHHSERWNIPVRIRWQSTILRVYNFYLMNFVFFFKPGTAVTVWDINYELLGIEKV